MPGATSGSRAPPYGATMRATRQTSGATSALALRASRVASQSRWTKYVEQSPNLLLPPFSFILPSLLSPPPPPPPPPPTPPPPPQPPPLPPQLFLPTIAATAYLFFSSGLSVLWLRAQRS
eukprot:6176040-Pleurochrysis_carterae.AAC.7